MVGRVAGSLVAATVLMVAGHSYGARLLPADSASSSTLVIYPDHQALVSQKFVLPTGNDPVLVVTGLSSKLMPDSLQASTGSGLVPRLEWHYQPLNANNFYSQLQGQAVELYGPALAKPVEGLLVHWSDGNGLVETLQGQQYLVNAHDKELRMRLPDKRFKAMDMSPQLKVQLPEQSGQHLSLNYRVQGISYSLQYRMIMSGDNKVALQQQVLLQNDTQQSFPQAQLVLAAGDRGVENGWRARSMMLASADAMPEAAPSSSAGTMNFTPLNQLQPLLAHSEAQVNLSRFDSLPVQEEYQLNVRLRSLTGNSNPLQPSRYLVWNSPAILPAGKLELYENDGDGALRWTGSSTLTNQAKNGQVNTRLGQSYSTPVSFTRMENKVENGVNVQRWQVSVRNLDQQEKTLELREIDPRLLDLSGASGIKGNTITLKVAAGKTKTVMVTARYDDRRNN